MKICIFADREIGAFVRDTIKSVKPDIELTVYYLNSNLIDSKLMQQNRYFHFESWDKSVLENVNQSNLVVLAWWPKIIPKSFFEEVKTPIINLHPSLLPIGRGKHPNFWAIVDEEKFGVTMHLIDQEIDSGLLIDQKEIPFDWTDTGESLYNKALDSIKSLFIAFIRGYIDKPEILTKKKLSTDKDIRFAKDIDPKRSLELEKHYRLKDILNILRASTFSGQPGATFRDGNEEFEVRINIVRKQKGD
jgi:methionyl-tRNA formyltransferase